MNKTIGIITLHSSINYGVYLQAYALQETIESLGFIPEIIDYTNMVEETFHKKKGIAYRVAHIGETLNAIKLRRFRNTKEAKNRVIEFRNFGKEYFRLSEPIENYEKLISVAKNYDSFVCGSDQIWNPNYTKANPAYFLAFADKDKRNMYAPSFGVTDYSAFLPYESKYREYINDIHSLSVRETSGIEITKRLSGRIPQVVVDPTLLLAEDKWASIEEQPNSLTGTKYILFYVLGFDKRYMALAHKLSKETGIKVATIPMVPIWKESDYIIPIYASVQNFISLIHHAELVVTDSFHGVAFSTVFKKNLIALKREDTKFCLTSRIEDYLTNVGLEQCCHTISECLYNSVSINSDYSLFEGKLSCWKRSSREFLFDSLK